jgi:exodeoxyribonuclease V beta subunit
LHQQLDWLSGEGFQLADTPPLMARLQARCERAHKDAAPALAKWLLQVVQHPMPGLARSPDVDQGVALADLTTVRSEMEFWLPAYRIQTRQLDQLCQTHLMPGVSRPSLQTTTLHGMLMGFMDLVFEHCGRYWVLDYKSNAAPQDLPELRQQMQLYRDALLAVYPGQTVKAAFLTAQGRLIAVD